MTGGAGPRRSRSRTGTGARAPSRGPASAAAGASAAGPGEEVLTEDGDVADPVRHPHRLPGMRDLPRVAVAVQRGFQVRPGVVAVDGVILDEERGAAPFQQPRHALDRVNVDRKSTRLNSSHQIISYAV